MRRLQVVLALFLLAECWLPHRMAAIPPEPDGIPELEEDEDSESQDVFAERVELYLSQRGQHARIDPLVRLQKSQQEYERRLSARGRLESKAATATPGDRWASLGPTNGAGRVTSIAPHPTAVGTVYVGAAGGGVWKTQDNGTTWTPLTDDLDDLSIGAVAIAPSSPDTIYLGTGEPSGTPGIGLVTSSDGGATWTYPAAVVARSFYRISVHPSNPQELVAGTDAGGLRSTDGGKTWSHFLDSVAVADIVRSASDPRVLFAATVASEVWKSVDAGVTWAPRSSGLPSTKVRLSLALSPSNPQALYAAGEIAGVAHVYKSTDGGQSWLDLDAVWTNPNAQGYMGGLGSWANTLVVVAGDPEVVVAGGVVAIRSADGGATWSALPGTHADFHDLRSQGSTLWLANDGGVWISPDAGVTAIDRNAGLVTRQYYAVANDPSLTDRILAGAQDNGTSMRTDAGSPWTRLDGGDGFDCAVSSWTRGVLYTSEQYGAIHRFDPGVGASATNALDAPKVITPPYDESEPKPFYTVLALDRRSPATIYTGSTRVWRSVDGGDSWAPLPTTTAGSTWNENAVTTIAVAPRDSSVLMVGKVSDVYRSADGGQTWTEADTGLPGDATINRLAIDPINAAIAYAALATNDGASVYRTTDAAAHWEPWSAGLPPVAALVVRVDPIASSVLYCGTEVGVFRSTDQGATWSRFGEGLPATSVQDLQVSDDGLLIRIATYGRGIWELGAANASANVTPRGDPIRPCPTGTAGPTLRRPICDAPAGD
jgi:photosystem II stability/assembly factor-like uncharacterized protein